MLRNYLLYQHFIVNIIIEVHIKHEYFNQLYEFGSTTNLCQKN